VTVPVGDDDGTRHGCSHEEETAMRDEGSGRRWWSSRKQAVPKWTRIRASVGLRIRVAIRTRLEPRPMATQPCRKVRTRRDGCSARFAWCAAGEIACAAAYFVGPAAIMPPPDAVADACAARSSGE
jgi:hypothetical protein